MFLLFSLSAAIITSKFDLVANYPGRYVRYPGIGRLTQPHAKAFCEAEGMILPVTCGGKMSEKLQRFMRKQGLGSVWGGFTDIEHEGTFVADPKSEMGPCTPTWAANQPDDLDNSDCVQFMSNGKYDDINCESKNDFICMKLPGAASIASDSGMFITFPYARGMSWHEAKNFCEKRSLKLPTICENEEEDFYTLPRWLYWVSYNDMEHEGKWTWDTERTCPGGKIKDMWGPRENGIHGGNEDCAIVIEGHAAPDAMQDSRCNSHWSTMVACMEDTCKGVTCPDSCPEYYTEEDHDECCPRCIKPDCSGHVCYAPNPSAQAKKWWPSAIPCSICCDETSWCASFFGVCVCK